MYMQQLYRIITAKELADIYKILLNTKEALVLDCIAIKNRTKFRSYLIGFRQWSYRTGLKSVCVSRLFTRLVGRRQHKKFS